MDQFLSAVFAGTSRGAIYALVALGLVLVWRGAGVINFAQMGQAMFSTYVASSMIMNGYSYWVAFFVALVVGTILGAVVDLLVMRPLSGKRSSAMLASPAMRGTIPVIASLASAISANHSSYLSFGGSKGNAIKSANCAVIGN